MNNLQPNKEEVKDRFNGQWSEFYSRYVEVTSEAGQWRKARCPLHNDKEPSFSFNNTTGRFRCFGCNEKGDPFDFYGKLKGISSFPGVLQGIASEFGMSSGQSTKKATSRILKTYDYHNEAREVVFQVCRMDPKDFRQRRPDGQGGWIWNMKGVERVLYGLQEVITAETILLLEGEKDVERVRSLGFTATTNVGGAEKWSDSYSASLEGKDVVIIPDNDDPGRRHVQVVGNSLKGVARSVRVLDLPGLQEHGDVSDWLDAGGTAEELVRLIESAPEFEVEGPPEDQWEHPVLLDEFSLPEMEPVPGIIGEFSQAVSQSTETPLELSQGLALAVVATCIQGKIEVSVKGDYSEPTNIWVDVSLESGNRKSADHSEVTRPLTTWEMERRDELMPAVRDAESRRKNQEARLKSLRARYGKAKRDELEELEKEIQELERDLIEIPILPQVWTQDVTPEHLGTLMARHGGRMAVLAAEGGIYDLIGGRYSSGVPNMDLFLQSHSGDPVRVGRESRESIYLQRPALTMGLSTQPEVHRNNADVKGFRGRGLQARPIYFFPESRLGYRSLETDPVPQRLREQWERVIHSLLNIEPSEDSRGNVSPYMISLSKSAFDEWMEFSRSVEADLREGGRFENITDWAGKLPGAVIRIAGIIHCAEHPSWPWEEKIQVETMTTALGLGAVASFHALKAFNIMGSDKVIEGARKVWRWIERQQDPSFRKNDCYNALKGTFPRVADIDPCLEVLEERNYIRPTREQRVGRPSIFYDVHPKLARRWK